MKLIMRMNVVLEEKQKFRIGVLALLCKMHLCEIERYFIVDGRCYMTVIAERRILRLLAKVTKQGYDTVEVVCTK